MHSPHAEKNQNSRGGPPPPGHGVKCSLPSILPRPQQTQQPESFENMEISEILQNKRKKEKSQAEVGRTRYISLNIYTRAIQNCTARAPGAAEAARGGRLGRPARVYCFEREEAAAGS